MPDLDERTIAREGLRRTVPFTLTRDANSDGEGGDGLTLEGHAAVFNAPTVIDSWEGRFKEEIARGAFKKTFAERTPVLQFDHGHHPLIGSIPIGRIRVAKEDQIGAYTKARLHDNWLIQPVRDAIADESITGMSFRFSVVREEWRDPSGNLIKEPREILDAIYNSYNADEADLLTRTLRELKVPELGPVVFPAYEATDVGVRSGQTVIDLGRLRRDPAERQRLARALWVAEQTAADEPTDDERDSDRCTPLTHPDRCHHAQRSAEDDPDREAGEDTEPGAERAHSAEPPDDADDVDVDHRSGAGQDDESRAGSEPPEGHSHPRPRMSRERRALTLDYIESRLNRSRERTALYQDRVADYEASLRSQEG